jgi:hypothetical protein
VGWMIRVQFPAGGMTGFFLFATMLRLALGPGTVDSYPRGKADHSPPSSSEVRIVWNCTFTPPVQLHGVGLN